MTFETIRVDLENVLLDPNNYRFLDNDKFRPKIADKFHNIPVQEITLNILEKTDSYQIKELVSSILENGFVPIEQIVVRKYEYDKGKYVVVEGNRRIAALKIILRDNHEGVIELDDQKKNSYKSINCTLVSADNMEEATRTIMGIRHIAGTKEWGAYQQAQLIHELINLQGLSTDEVANRLGMTKVETNRRYRAMSALKQMESDEEYGEHTKKEQYRLFHELISQPEVREIFGWNNEISKFTDIAKARLFFELIAPQSENSEPKLLTYADVRKLKFVVGNRRAFETLLDPDKTFREVQLLLEPIAQASSGLDKQIIIDFKAFINQISVDELAGLSEEEAASLNEIADRISDRLEARKRLIN